MLKAVTVGAVAVSALSTAAEHDAARMEEIKRINSIPGVTWKAGIAARFRGQPEGASKPLLGVKPDQLDRIQKSIQAGEIEVVHASDDFVPPAEFDSETNWPVCAKVIGDIRDQSNCGCCWAFGGASAASDRLCIATNGTVQVPLSSQDVCFGASSDGCGGGYLDDTWSFVKAGVVTGGNQADTGPLGGGFCSAFSLPHCHHHGPTGSDPYPAEGTPGCPSESSPRAPIACDKTAVAPHNTFSKDKYSFTGTVASFSNVAAIQQAIMQHGPVESAFTVYGDFENYAGGIYHQTSVKVLGGHAIRMVGWGSENGVDYWKVANSWNPYWGEDGYFRIKRGNGACGMESQAMANGAASVWHGPGL